MLLLPILPCTKLNATPISLHSQVLSFGSWFDQSLKDVIFPDSLTTLDLSRDFNQQIDDVVWPKRLARLTFGFFFSRSIEAAAKNWPPTLEYLQMGDCYNLPIRDVEWPGGLLEVGMSVSIVCITAAYVARGGSTSTLCSLYGDGNRALSTCLPR